MDHSQRGAAARGFWEYPEVEMRPPTNETTAMPTTAATAAFKRPGICIVQEVVGPPGNLAPSSQFLAAVATMRTANPKKITTKSTTMSHSPIVPNAAGTIQPTAKKIDVRVARQKTALAPITLDAALLTGLANKPGPDTTEP
jgi:hypothetical protein